MQSLGFGYFPNISFGQVNGSGDDEVVAVVVTGVIVVVFVIVGVVVVGIVVVVTVVVVAAIKF